MYCCSAEPEEFLLIVSQYLILAELAIEEAVVVLQHLAAVSRFRCGDHHGRISRRHEQDVGHESWVEVSLHSFHRVRRLEPGGLPPLVPQESNLDGKMVSEDIQNK